MSSRYPIVPGENGPLAMSNTPADRDSLRNSWSTAMAKARRTSTSWRGESAATLIRA